MWFRIYALACRNSFVLILISTKHKQQVQFSRKSPYPFDNAVPQIYERLISLLTSLLSINLESTESVQLQ